MKYGWILILLGVVPLIASETNPPQFARDVAPILHQKCGTCHGPNNRMQGLDLHEASLVLRGSENGPVIVKGSAKESLLIKRVREGSMPPGGKNRLDDREIAVLERWIDAGAPGASAASGNDPVDASAVSDEDRQFWSFRVLQRPAIPNVGQHGLVRTPVDAFLLAKLEANNLSYTKEADRATLARRAYLDLLGLPPAPQEVDAFVSDRSPDAFAKLLDKLLASPHYGERWGRHWLDLAGYVDTVGRDVQSNGYKIGPGRWRYRDYVIRAFNQDKPFDKFLTEQIAGDELFDRRSISRYSPEQLDRLIATGFLRTAEDPTDNPERDTPLLRYEVIHQTLDILTSSVLGVTVGCARCHNHKFDPIPQKDYYSLMATLTPAYNPVQWTPVLKRTLPDVPPSEQATLDAHNAQLEEAIKPKKAELDQLYAAIKLPLLDAALAEIPEKDREAAKKAALASEEMRNAKQKKLVAALKVDISHATLLAGMPAQEQVRARQLQSEIEELESQRRVYNSLEALYDTGESPETYVHRRGDFESKGEAVQPAGLEVLSKPGEILEEPLEFSSGRRLALAKWLTRKGTPAASLVARVYVNRTWMHLFGEPIVGTPDNFGKMGALPTHPELLEWLSDEFIRSRWSTKALIRTMMLSRAYQASSLPADYSKMAGTPDPLNVDPDNTLLWRMRLRRLESEVIRDSMLAISGKLNTQIGGPPVPTTTEADGMVLIDDSKLAEADDRYRRSLYLVARRRYNLSMLGVFDHPVMSTNAKERGTSAVVLQSLMMMNDKEVLTQSRNFADRVAGSAGLEASDRELIETAYRFALARLPNQVEIETLSGLLERERQRFRNDGKPVGEAALGALASVCHVLLNSNEFLYVE